METFKQKARVGVAGSFFNQLMSNNSSIPEVGKGATIMYYTDRTCAEVIEVSNDGKTVKLESLQARYDNTRMGDIGHQSWILEPTGQFFTVVWRHNAWRTKREVITFLPKFLKEEIGSEWYHSAERKNCFDSDGHLKVVEGYTHRKFVYDKIRILFGQKNYYYDWSF